MSATVVQPADELGNLTDDQLDERIVRHGDMLDQANAELVRRGRPPLEVSPSTTEVREVLTRIRAVSHLPADDPERVAAIEAKREVLGRIEATS